VLRDLGLEVSLLVDEGQAWREAPERRVALVEAGPILRTVLDFEFRIRVSSVEERRVSGAEGGNFFGYRGLL
jgi:hypothetical protein